MHGACINKLRKKYPTVNSVAEKSHEGKMGGRGYVNMEEFVEELIWGRGKQKDPLYNFFKNS